jgi:CDP-paratose 2-epimerase
MRYLITGGCGFLGSNLSQAVIKNGAHLTIFDNLSRLGSEVNLAWLKQQGDFSFSHGDIRNQNDIDTLIKNTKPDVIFHLAGQVAMTTSLKDPQKDFEINAMGSLYLLESVKKYAKDACVIYSSTNKVYGNLDQFNYIEKDTRYEIKGFESGLNEYVNLDFRSPYGCSKGAADQYMLEYARNFNLNTIVLRHSSIFGGRQYSTYDQGWVGWFIQQALLIKKGLHSKPIKISGDGKQVRDVLFSEDLIDCYFLAANSINTSRGHAFNIGGGPSNSMSLLELFSFLEAELEVTLEIEKNEWRSNDQKVFIADITKAKKYFEWEPKEDKFSGLKKMISWVNSQI